MPLEADEGVADLVGVAELRRAFADGAVFQFQQRAQFCPVEFADAFLHILRQHEIDEGAKFFVMVGQDAVRRRATRSRRVTGGRAKAI